MTIIYEKNGVKGQATFYSIDEIQNSYRNIRNNEKEKAKLLKDYEKKQATFLKRLSTLKITYSICI